MALTFNRLGIPILVCHILLMVLAATNLSLVTIAVDGEWECCFYAYHFANGFGEPYSSPYSSLQVGLYWIACFAGLAAYVPTYLKNRTWLSAAGVVLCLVGLLSFTVEASHWWFDHHRSWIVIVPSLMVVLAIAQLFQFRSQYNSSGQLPAAAEV